MKNGKTNTETKEKQQKLKENKMCLFPKLIKNRKYITNKKNGGVIPAIIDNRTMMVPVGCVK